MTATVASAREQLIELYRAAIAGANVESLTASAVAGIPVERRHRVWVFAFGKAAHAMANAACTTLQRALGEIAGGIVVAPDEGPPPCGTVGVVVGDHPIPGRRSFGAAARIGQTLTKKRAADLGIVLLSGGASSLIAAPLRGMSEADLSHLYELLLGSGLDIHQMNAIRKRFSYWAAGRMALALAPARTYCFAVSDVPGDNLASIGSGPCVPDPTRVQHIIDTLSRIELFGKIAPSFRRHLIDTARGVIPETPKESHPAFAHVNARVVASNTIALTAAAAAARRQGFDTLVEDQPLVGDAAQAGARVADALLAVSRHGGGTPHCRIWGGETTVALRGPAPAGGRCQELALAAAQRLAGAGDSAASISILAAGTDGRDGTTDAAGAIVDGSTWGAISASAHDPAVSLRTHESHAALSAANALFSPGLTGTNVMDVTIGLVRN